MHGDSSFLTLTYSEENLPEGGTLVPKDAQDFLKRLRKAFSPRALRFYLVGEYGDQTWRPHYHAALFGVSPLEEQIVAKAWGLGHVMLGDLSVQSASYVAGYVTKKMRKKLDPRLGNRHPEFARMSLRPGIGALAIETVAHALESGFGAELVQETGDVPSGLKHGARMMPLGRYLRQKLRKQLGRSIETPFDSAAIQDYGASLRVVFKEALQAPENRSKTLKQIIVDLNQQKRLNQQAKSKIFSPKGSL